MYKVKSKESGSEEQFGLQGTCCLGGLGEGGCGREMVGPRLSKVGEILFSSPTKAIYSRSVRCNHLEMRKFMGAIT